MAVRSRALGHRTTLPADVVTDIWTCPAGRTARVHRLAVVNRGTATQTVELGVRNAAGATYFIARFALPASSDRIETDSGLVLEPGSTWHARAVAATATVNVAVSAHGSLLEGAPA